MALRRIIYLILPGFLLLAGCAPQSAAVLSPVSGLAGKEAELYNLLFYMGVGVFLFVFAIFVIALVRGYRRARQAGEVKQVQGSVPLEVLWTAIPILIVVFIFIMTVRTMNAVAAPPPASQDLTVKVIGHRWWWEFDYPGYGVITANEMHIPVGVNVHLEVTSVDVVHSFWAPNLNGKMDVVPGIVNKTWIRSDKEGVFSGHCTEYCGLQHANMNFNVVAQSQTDFDAWVSQMQGVPAEPTTDEAKKGKEIVTQGICSTCHMVAGTNAKANIGPNLTHVYSRSIMAGGVQPMDAGHMYAWLKDNASIKPDNLMSGVKLSEEQIREVMSYLSTLK